MPSSLTSVLFRAFSGRGLRMTLVLTGVLLTLFLAGLFVFQPFFLRLMENKVYDAMLRFTSSGEASEQIIIVDLDEESLEEFGQWPWPRYRVALLLDKLRRAGSVSVGLDVVFAEKDRTSPRIIRDQLRRELNVEIEFTGLPPALDDNDAIMANVLAQGPFALGYYLDMRTPRESHRQHQLHPLQAAVVGAPEAPALEDSLFPAQGVTGNIDVLARSAPNSGFINVAPDEDGVIRRAPLLMAYNGRFYPSLALAVLLNTLDAGQVLVHSSSSGPEFMRLQQIQIPMDSKGQLLLNYRGPGRSFEYISARDILYDRLNPDHLEGKIILVGTSAAGLKDIRATPFDPAYPGVEIQATVMDNILSGDFLHRPDWALGLELILVVGLGLFSTAILSWLGGLWLVLPLGICAAGVWWGSAHLLGAHGMYISPFMPLLTLAGNFSVLNVQKFWIEEREKRKTRRTFEHYLSPEVISRVMKNPQLLRLGGEKRDLSILFADIRNFTSISESLEPGELVDFMNDYLSNMTEVILNNGGTLDKYIGDAIMAFFGAPEDMPDHALRVYVTAMEMLERLDQCRNRWCFPGFPPVDIGVGISSGEVIVGNIGSSKRFNYTVMGDQVNLAARLEGLTKTYGVRALLSEFTREKAGPEMVCREIDLVRVKGRERAVAVFEPLVQDVVTNGRSAFIQPFEQGLDAYRLQRWDEAIGFFERVLELKPEDKPSLVYINRCRMMAQDPPGADWDGVWVMETK